MQNSNSIYEIAELMKNENYIQNDIAQVAKLVSDFFKNKYIASFENEIKTQSASIKNNPSKEMRLLALMKEFIPQQSSDIDNILNAFTTASAFSSIQKKLKPEKTDLQNNVIKAASVDPSVKADGVYDIDENCKVSTQRTSPINFSSMLAIIFLIAVLSESNN